MFSQNQVQHLMIGKASVNLTAGAVKPAALAVGEIGAFTKGGTKYIESASAPGLPFVLYKKMNDGSFTKSDVISLANVEKVIRKVGTAATEKLEYYGYNGSTGSIEALDETFYRIHLNFNEGFTLNNHGTGYVKHAIYESDATATQAEIAIGLAKSGNSNMDREIRRGVRPVEFEAVCNVALASDFVFDATFEITGTNGSKILSVAAATPTYNTGTVLAVGDYLRIGTLTGATGGAVVLGSGVYKVTALPTTTTIELDRPLMTASGSYLIADGSITVVTAALGNAANWGVKITGQSQAALTSASVGLIADEVINWTSTIENAGTTTYTSSTSATPGINTADQIAQLEWFCQGNEGNFDRKGYPYTQPSRFETEATVYETIDIVYNDAVNGVISAATNRKVLTIALPSSNPDFWTNGIDGLADVLGDLLTGAPMYGGITTNNGAPMVAGDLD